MQENSLPSNIFFGYLCAVTLTKIKCKYTITITITITIPNIALVCQNATYN